MNPPGPRIPAGAGSTASTHFTATAATAHPRRRGEHNTVVRDFDRQFGSSPQARGARCRYGRGHELWRLIPAGAGSTLRAQSPAPHDRAHPRRRGEHSSHPAPVIAYAGSSPQARGAPFVTSIFFSAFRIPASVFVSEIAGIGWPCSIHAGDLQRVELVRWDVSSAGCRHSRSAPSHVGEL